MKKTGIIIGIIIIILAIMAIISYNGIISKKENVDSKLADLNVMLQRRGDLIPNLVNTVKGYTKHEEEIINRITKARANLVNAGSIEEKANANNELTKSLNALIVIAENYPDLKASTNFTQLMDELTGTENRITVARKDYNEAVKKYNTSIVKFPSNIFANTFGFEKGTYFEAEESSMEVPSVNFE